MVEAVGPQQIQVFAVLPPDHTILTINLVREQRHAFIARCCAADRNQVELAKVGCPQQLRRNRLTAIGCIGANPFARPVIMIELDQTQIFKTIALGLGHRKNHCSRNRRIFLAVDRCGRRPLCLFAIEHRRCSDFGFGQKAEVAVGGHNAFAKSDRRNMTFTNRTQR